MIKVSVPQENIAILNVYAPKKRASKYMKQQLTELKEETDKSTILETSVLLSQSSIEQVNRKLSRYQNMYMLNIYNSYLSIIPQ